MECELCGEYESPPYELDDGTIVCQGCFWDEHDRYFDVPRTEWAVPE